MPPFLRTYPPFDNNMFTLQVSKLAFWRHIYASYALQVDIQLHVLITFGGILFYYVVHC